MKVILAPSLFYSKNFPLPFLFRIDSIFPDCNTEKYKCQKLHLPNNFSPAVKFIVIIQDSKQPPKFHVKTIPEKPHRFRQQLMTFHTNQQPQLLVACSKSVSSISSPNIYCFHKMIINSRQGSEQYLFNLCEEQSHQCSIPEKLKCFQFLFLLDGTKTSVFKTSVFTMSC